MHEELWLQSLGQVELLRGEVWEWLGSSWRMDRSDWRYRGGRRSRGEGSASHGKCISHYVYTSIVCIHHPSDT